MTIKMKKRKMINIILMKKKNLKMEKILKIKKIKKEEK